jgi:hypothetical protein
MRTLHILQRRCLTYIKESLLNKDECPWNLGKGAHPVPTETVTEVQSIAESIPQIHTQVYAPVSLLLNRTLATHIYMAC